MEFKDEIIKYIEQNEFCGALLITGKWGSGKTYLLEDIKKELSISKTSVMVIISMFGVENAEALNRKIKNDILISLFNTTDEKVKRFDAISETITKTIESFGKVPAVVGKIKNAINIDLYELYDLISKPILGDRELVLVFDDFERSTIPADVRIGIINEYVEKRKIHTIIVADQEKIRDKKYDEFKEKVISRTLSLHPDYNKIIKGLINSYEETAVNYRCFLQCSLSMIKCSFIESKSDNIRTLKSILTDFERVYSLWKRNGYSVADEAFPYVLYSFAVAAFEIKSGNVKLEQLSEKYSLYGKNGSNLKSLQNWIRTGEWAEEFICYEIKEKIFPPEITEEYKFLNYNPWELDGTTVNEAMPVVLKNAYSGGCTVTEMISLLKKISFFREHAILDEFEYDSDLLLAGWKMRVNKIKSGTVKEVIYDSHIWSDTVSMLNDSEKQIYKEINQIGYQISAWENRRRILEGIKAGNIEQNMGKYSDLYDIDDELMNAIIDFYPSCSNSERRAIFSEINSVDLRRIEPEELRNVTINNIEKFIELLNTQITSEEDVIAKTLATTGLKLLSEKIGDDI